jgi:hypothetical protein
MAFSVKSKKTGQTYWLHCKDVRLKSTGKIQRIYYFSKDPTGAIDMPTGFKVIESERTGLPLLKKA